MGLVLALAAATLPERISVTRINPASCDPASGRIGVAFEASVNGSLGVEMRLQNRRTGEASTSRLAWTYGSGTFSLYAVPPQGTLPGDVLTVTLTLSRGGAVRASDTYSFDCGTGQAPALPLPAGQIVKPLNGFDTWALTHWPDAAGRRPCAAFDLDGWGAKSLIYEEFPACPVTTPAPVFSVECLTEQGAWTAAEVHNVTADPSGLFMSFEVTQHGRCAVFPN
ncbi:MAG: hypothetical protein IT326_06340 [Anaerolineae bacterium]|nr:hypothetical protein [Anaerolineae bacterium]